MDQKKIGIFISEKRKENHLTQEQLAEQLGVTNKAVSKWENGKCMPDISLIQQLCEILHISVNELLNGEEDSESDEMLVHLLWIVNKLKSFKTILLGLIVCNIPMVLEKLWPIQQATRETESAMREFIRGLLNGTFAGVKIIGIAIFAYGIMMYVKENSKMKE